MDPWGNIEYFEIELAAPNSSVTRNTADVGCGRSKIIQPLHFEK